MEKPEGNRLLGRHSRKITLDFIFQKSAGGVDWIDLVRERDRWEAVVYSVINVRVK